MRGRLIRAYCLLVGAMDVATGLLLVAAPLVTLRLMRVAERPEEPLWLRFIGAFVAGVGGLYFLALTREGRRLAAFMEATAVVRLCIATFVGVALVARALSPPWLLVCASDAGLATLQLVLLRKGLFDATH